MLDEKSAIEDQQYPLTLQWRDELSIKLENVSFQDKTTKNYI